MISVHIIGSGVAGLSCAYTLAKQGCQVQLSTASNGPDESCCSWWAGGMLAPYCEQVNSEPLIGKLGVESMAFWKQFAQVRNTDFSENGTLVIAPPRDTRLLNQFNRKTEGGHSLKPEELLDLEPDLSNHQSGLYFPQEAHIAPRETILGLWESLRHSSVKLCTNTPLSEEMLAEHAKTVDWQIDCRGLAAESVLRDLRGVKGEMLRLRTPEITFSRPIRLLHPRHPIYIVPRPNNEFMLGATMIEANRGKNLTVRSALELLSAAYAINPAFAEAQIIEIGADSRPAFDDNLPKIRRFGNTIHVNGLFRHGFLVAPALARRVSDLILTNTICEEVVDENHP